MVALDFKGPKNRWTVHAHELVRRLKEECGCADFKTHLPLWPDSTLKATHGYIKRPLWLPETQSFLMPTVMTDPKSSDTGSTVLEALDRHLEDGADLVTVHGTAGRHVFRYLEANKTDMSRIVAVTILTSMPEEDIRENYKASRKEAVVLFANIAWEYDVENLVCEARDIPQIKQEIPGTATDATFMCPGIRLPGGDKHDQEVTSTPSEAAALGAHVLIIGRAITEAEDPIKAYREIEGMIT